MVRKQRSGKREVCNKVEVCQETVSSDAVQV
jgi:hypothetical protein